MRPSTTTSRHQLHLVRHKTHHQLSQRGVRLYVEWVNAEATNIHEDFIIPRWLSWRGVSLHVDSVDVETHLVLTQLMRNETPCQLSHRWMLKNLNKSANSRTKSKKFGSLIIWPIQWAQKVWRVWSQNYVYWLNYISTLRYAREVWFFFVLQILDRRTILSIKPTKCGLKILYKKGFNYHLKNMRFF
jgi:hypothetical protein